MPYETARVSVKSLSSLSENSILRYVTFVVLYFSQGIPEGITIFAIPAWMAINGKSATEIAGYSAVIMIPFSLKILLAPVMERFTYLPMGRRRPWLLFGQFGILCSLIAFSFVPDPLNNMHLITTVALFVHISIMFQDISTDSLVIDVTPLEQQGKANSLMWGSKTIGTSFSLFVGSWLIVEFGFPKAMLMMSASVFVIMFVPLLLRERSGEKLLPWSKGRTSPDSAFLAIDSWGKLFKSFIQVIVLRNTTLLIVAVFTTMAAIHYMITLLPIFTIQELGWESVFYSKIFSIYNLVGGVIGMVIGGFIIQRFGILSLIQGSLFFTALLSVSMAVLMPFWKNADFVSGFIAIYSILRTLIYIGVLALAMHLCWKRISAMQFTFCMTIFNAGLACGAALLGWLRSYFEWQSLFFAFAGIIMVAMVILVFIKTNKHREQVELLEQKYVDILKKEGSLLVKSETN